MNMSNYLEIKKCKAGVYTRFHRAVHFEGGRGAGGHGGFKNDMGKRSPAKKCVSPKFIYVIFSVTQSFLLGLSSSSDSIIKKKKKEKHIKAPISVYLR